MPEGAICNISVATTDKWKTEHEMQEDGMVSGRLLRQAR
jgi:hypothetical protein